MSLTKNNNNKIVKGLGNQKPKFTLFFKYICFRKLIEYPKYTCKIKHLH